MISRRSSSLISLTPSLSADFTSQSFSTLCSTPSLSLQRINGNSTFGIFIPPRTTSLKKPPPLPKKWFSWPLLQAKRFDESLLISQFVDLCQSGDVIRLKSIIPKAHFHAPLPLPFGIMRLLMLNGISGKLVYTPLMAAIRHGNINVLRFCIASRYFEDIGMNDESALFCCSGTL